jgi:hypothetical protein
VEDFHHTPPTFAISQPTYVNAGLTLLVQLSAALTFAWLAVARAHLRSTFE